MAETNYQVEEKDTVAGRLNTSANFTSPLAKRVAHTASQKAKSRGVNSTISIGAALGGMLDNATDVAKTDSSNIISANVQSSVNSTSMRNVDAQNTTSTAIAQANNQTSRDNVLLTTDTQKTIQQESDKASGERLAAQIAAQTSEGAANREADATSLASQIASAEKIATQSETNKAALTREGFAENKANLGTELDQQKELALQELAGRIAMDAGGNEVRREEIAAQERISQASITASKERDDLDRSSREFIATLDKDSQAALEEIRQEFDTQRQAREHVNNIELETMRSINNIDVNASAASKQAAVNQITQTAKATLASANAAADEIRLDSLIAKQNDTNRAAGQGVTDQEAREAYEIALAQGLSADELDAMAGLPAGSGVAQAFIDRMGWPSL